MTIMLAMQPVCNKRLLDDHSGITSMNKHTRLQPDLSSMYFPSSSQSRNEHSQPSVDTSFITHNVDLNRAIPQSNCIASMDDCHYSSELTSVDSNSSRLSCEAKIRDLSKDDSGTNGTYTEEGPSLQELNDPRGPYHVQMRIKLAVERWGTVTPIPPDRFLAKLLTSRGYDTTLIPSVIFRKRPPDSQQIHDYDKDMVTAVRNSDLKTLRRFFSEGRSMSACNKFSESIVHMACRRADFETVDFIIRHGGDTGLIDDYGRTPLHDACWRSSPRFDVVTLLLDRNLDLLRMVDVRGANALKYICQDHWLEWCAYFFHQKEKYWPIKTELTNNTTQMPTHPTTIVSNLS